ncbi:MAG: hypothetical protein IKS49_00290 [Actinomycetaceae bacterium]|nr:hypothetical protein [Actinomycetaceae bacterium]
MAKKHTKDFHSTAHGNTYKPEWAEEFDTDKPASPRSDSERLDRAIERGVEAAEALERDETLGLIPPRQRSRRRPAAMLAALVIAGAGVGVALSPKQSELPSSSQQEIEEGQQKSGGDQQESQQEEEETPIEPTKRDDGIYSAHVVLETSKYDSEKYVIVPSAVESHKRPWAIRVHTTIDTSSQWMSSCLIRNGLHGGLITRTDWCDELDRESKVAIVEWREAVGEHRPNDNDYSWMRQSDVEQIHPLPKIKTSYDPKEQEATLKVSGASVSMDIDFIPVSTLAVPWDRSEPLRGNNSTFIAFSGSLDNLTLNYGGGDLALYAYGRSVCGSSDEDGWVNLKKDDNAYKVLTDLKTECIDELGFNKENASGYLFVEARTNAYDASSPLWWTLN